MSLIANLFSPARTFKPSAHTPPSSTPPAGDSAPSSFSEALESARQPQQAPEAHTTQAPAVDAAKPKDKLSRPDKNSSQTDDASADPSTTDASNADASNADASTVPTPSQSDAPVDSAAPKKLSAPSVADDSDVAPTDPTPSQVATIAVAQAQPLPATQPLPLQKTPAIPTESVTPANQPVQGSPQRPQNLNADQQNPSLPSSPVQAAKTASAKPQPVPASSPDLPQPEDPTLKPSAKKPAPLVATPAPEKKPDAPAAADTLPPRADSPAIPTPSPEEPAPSFLATQHPNSKLASATAHNTQSADSATTPAAAPASAPSQPTPSDTTVIAESITPTLPTATDDPAPAAPQSSTSPIPLTTANNPNHAIDNRATPAAPAQDSPRPANDPTFDQIVLGLRTKMDATHSRAEISLNPPNLGTLHVSVSLQNGSLTAQFQSSSEVVRDLLKGNMEKLKSVLESQGVTVDNLAVGAPQDKTELPSASPATAQTNQSANDGRSAGQYNQDSQNRKRSQDPGAFARNWQQATAKAPIDLVA